MSRCGVCVPNIRGRRENEKGREEREGTGEILRALGGFDRGLAKIEARSSSLRAGDPYGLFEHASFESAGGDFNQA